MRPANIDAGRRAPTEAFALVISDVVSIGGVKLKAATSQSVSQTLAACLILMFSRTSIPHRAQPCTSVWRMNCLIRRQ